VGTIRFDWRWIALIVVVLLLANARSLPWPIVAAALGGSGGYLIVLGWRAWTRSGGPPSRGRVTYWRGQRIETPPSRGGPALPRLSDIGPALIYFLIGGVLLLAAVARVLRELGI
jgi:hypothetical protein